MQKFEASAAEMALSSIGSLSLTAALRSVTFCLVNPGWRVKVGGFFSLPRVFAGETNDATNVRSRRAATIKWMGCPVITDGMRSLSAFVSACLPVFGVKKKVFSFFFLFKITTNNY